MEKQKQFVDELLDSGLAQYTDVTPRPGLEHRLLEAFAERDGRPWFGLAGRLAVGLAAATVIVGVISLSHRRTPNAAPDITATRQSPAAIEPGFIAHNAQPLQTHRRSFQAGMHGAPRASANPMAAGPRLAQFPSPKPLTEQEKLLLEYVRLNSPGVLSATCTESADIPALEIKELEITPLDSEQTGAQPN